MPGGAAIGGRNANRAFGVAIDAHPPGVGMHLQVILSKDCCNGTLQGTSRKKRVAETVRLVFAPSATLPFGKASVSELAAPTRTCVPTGRISPAAVAGVKAIGAAPGSVTSTAPVKLTIPTPPPTTTRCA